jgi:type VI secretion system secreted protein Hcp
MPLDYFLHIDGIPGDSRALGFHGHIELVSWNWGADFDRHAPVTGTELPPLRMAAFEVVKRVDRASAKLMLACASRRLLKQALLNSVKAGGDHLNVLRITLSEVYVTAYRISGDAGGEWPTEQFGLAFDRIELETTEVRMDGRAAGVVRSGWDSRTDQPC